MKIQVDETGNFGREANPNLKPTHDEKYPDVLNNPEWHKFETGVKSYPLTLPQAPLSAVYGELVWQIETGVQGQLSTYTWNTVTEDQYNNAKKYAGKKYVRQAYHIPKTIDGFAPNSGTGCPFDGSGTVGVQFISDATTPFDILKRANVLTHPDCGYIRKNMPVKMIEACMKAFVKIETSNLQSDNTQLRELLKECREELYWLSSEPSELLTKLDTLLTKV